MKPWWMMMFLAVPCFAAVDPQEDAGALEQLLREDFVQEELAWVRKQSFQDATYSEFRIVTRENRDDMSHYFMFLSSDWKYICQISVRAEWTPHREGWSLRKAKLESESVCFPRMN